MELWDLLDENRNKTGKTLVRGEELPKGLYHAGVDIWIRNSKGELLIQKRSNEKESYPGMWAMTGGSIISGESSINAAHRETLEELGIDIDISKLEFLFTVKTKKTFIDSYLYEVDIDVKDLKLQAEEVQDAKWFTVEEIDELTRNKKFIATRWKNARDFLIKK